MIQEFSRVTIRIKDTYVQTRMYITAAEYQRDRDLEKENPKYKRKYNMYNCLVEASPLLAELKEWKIGSIFNYRIPFNGGHDCKIEILNIEQPDGTDQRKHEVDNL